MSRKPTLTMGRVGRTSLPMEATDSAPEYYESPWGVDGIAERNVKARRDLSKHGKPLLDTSPQWDFVDRPLHQYRGGTGQDGLPLNWIIKPPAPTDFELALYGMGFFVHRLDLHRYKFYRKWIWNVDDDIGMEQSDHYFGGLPVRNNIARVTVKRRYDNDQGAVFIAESLLPAGFTRTLSDGQVRDNIRHGRRPSKSTWSPKFLAFNAIVLKTSAYNPPKNLRTRDAAELFIWCQEMYEAAATFYKLAYGDITYE